MLGHGFVLRLHALLGAAPVTLPCPPPSHTHTQLVHPPSCDPFWLLSSVGNGTYVFDDVELVFGAPGRFRVVAVADSVSSPPSTSRVNVRFRGDATPWERIRTYLIVCGLFLLSASIGLGG